jgi:uncharacterized protein YbjT (DUF2867 family)
MKKRSALVLGATGLVGGYCLRYLLDEPMYTRVAVLARKPITIQHEKLVHLVADFDECEALGDWMTADDVFCCLGTTIKKAGSQDAFRRVDFDYTIKLAALTQHCGARQFLIVTSLGADSHSRIFYSRVKGEIEDALRKVPFNALHIFRPSLLIGVRPEHRTSEIAGMLFLSGLKYAMTGPLKKYRTIRASDVARAMVGVALWDMSGIRVYESNQIQELADSFKNIK